MINAHANVGCLRSCFTHPIVAKSNNYVAMCVYVCVYVYCIYIHMDICMPVCVCSMYVCMYVSLHVLLTNLSCMRAEILEFGQD